MKTIRYFLLVLPILLLTASCEIFEKSLSDEEIVAGLKEALQVGTDTAVARTHKTDGYYGNSLIRIPFPQELELVKDAVSAIPFVGQPAIDALVLKLNRAAEDAADEAGPIFLNAITNMTIEDGINILKGEDDAATQYLNSKTYADLKTTFKPDIENSLNQVGAQDAFNEVATLYNTVSPGSPVNADLADYTTGKALDGLFTLIAGEELRIRQDPAARVTDLLQKVFAEQDD